MALPQRRLKDLRTLSEKFDQSLYPYRSFVRLSSIEMEMGRRDVERRNSVRRIAVIDAHCVALRAEKEQILRELGKAGTLSAPGQAPGAEARLSRFYY